MARSTEIIELLFNAKYGGKAEIRALRRDVSQLGDDLKSGVSAAAGLTTALGLMQVAAVAAGVGLAKAGVGQAGAFQAGFNELATLIGDVDGGLSGFEQSILNYASTSTSSLEDINLALYSSISAGIDYKDSIEFLSVAEKLSVAGKATLADSVQVLTGNLSAYGQETSEATRFSDILFNTVKNGVTTIPELVASLGQITGTAASLGVSFEEVSAATSTLTKNNIDTSRTMTALKAVINSIINPTRKAQEVADDLGISLGVQALESKGLIGVMEEMADKTGGSKVAMSELFSSTEALNGALILTSKSGLQTFQADLADLAGATGVTSDAFELMKDNVGLIGQTLQNNIQLTLIGIGAPLIDEFQDINTAITDVFSSINDNLGGGGSLTLITDGMSTIASTVADIIASIAVNIDEALNLATFSGFTGALDQINQGLTGLNLTSPQGLANAIDAIGNAFNGLTSFTSGAFSVMDGLIDVFIELERILKGVDGEFLKTAGSIGGWAIAIGIASAALSPFIAIIKALVNVGGVAGALGKVSAVTAMTSSLKGFGAAGVAAFAVFQSPKLGGAIVETVNNLTGLTDAMYATTKVTPQLQQAVDDYAKSIGRSSLTIKEYTSLMREKHSVDSSGLDTVSKMRDSEESLLQARHDAAPAITRQFTEEEKLRAARVVNGITIDESTGKIVDNRVEIEKLTQATKPNIQGILGMSRAASVAKKSLDTLNSFKPLFDFQTAKVQAEASKIEAIMGSLATSSKAAGDSMTAALSALTSENYADLDLFEQQAIEDAVKKMTDAQAAAVEATTEVARAQAAYLDAQAQSLNSGNPLIEIDGAGLEPELEAFMFKILERIQVKVAQDKQSFLLGI